MTNENFHTEGWHRSYSSVPSQYVKQTRSQWRHHHELPKAGARAKRQSSIQLFTKIEMNTITPICLKTENTQSIVTQVAYIYSQTYFLFLFISRQSHCWHVDFQRHFTLLCLILKLIDPVVSLCVTVTALKSPINAKPKRNKLLVLNVWPHISQSLGVHLLHIATVTGEEPAAMWPANQSQTHPIKESSPSWLPPSTMAWDRAVRGSFFWRGEKCTMIRLRS